MAFSFIMLGILIVWVILFLAETVAFIPKMIVKTAPKDIQEKVLARPDAPKWKTVTGLILAVLLLLCIAGVLVWAGVDALQKDMGFGEIWLRYLILLEGYKLFDIVFFDWILLTKLHIFQHFFPETVGCKGYNSFGFNGKSQIAKMILFAVISAAVAGVLCLL